MSLCKKGYESFNSGMRLIPFIRFHLSRSRVKRVDYGALLEDVEFPVLKPEGVFVVVVVLVEPEVVGIPEEVCDPECSDVVEEVDEPVELFPFDPTRPVPVIPLRRFCKTLFAIPEFPLVLLMAC